MSILDIEEGITEYVVSYDRLLSVSDVARVNAINSRYDDVHRNKIIENMRIEGGTYVGCILINCSILGAMLNGCAIEHSYLNNCTICNSVIVSSVMLRANAFNSKIVGRLSVTNCTFMICKFFDTVVSAICNTTFIRCNCGYLEVYKESDGIAPIWVFAANFETSRHRTHYTPVIYTTDRNDGLYISSGCRVYTFAGAADHWLEPAYNDNVPLQSAYGHIYYNVFMKFLHTGLTCEARDLVYKMTGVKVLLSGRARFCARWQDLRTTTTTCQIIDGVTYFSLSPEDLLKVLYELTPQDTLVRHRELPTKGVAKFTIGGMH